jgi:hypothetical protein
MFWVYVLENTAGRFRVGQTDDLEQDAPTIALKS